MRKAGIAAILAGCCFTLACSAQEEAAPAPVVEEVVEVAEVAPPTVNLDPANAKARTRTHCETLYPADFTMRAACERNGARGLESFTKIWNDHEQDPEFRAALATCYANYTSEQGIDFAIMAGCARNQLRGYEQVRN